MRFVDTNVLVYCFDDSDTSKRDRARLVMRQLWESRTGCVSHQVLQEFYLTVTRKLRPALPRSKAREEVEDLLGWQPAPVTGDLVRDAWRIEDRFELSWWDSLIVASALAQNCHTLLTEDLQDGLEIDDLRVLNPFAPSFDPAVMAR
jgi:predicted nucleic acid-binding protein